MKKMIASFFIFMLFLIIGLPALLARGCRAPAALEPPVAIDRTPIESPAGEVLISVYQHDTNELVEMTLEEYLVGVVAAEMPAAFGLEALKAQAVSARTYTVNQMRIFGGNGCDKHPDADICTDFSHCQAWESEDISLVKWPESQAAAFLNKIRTAVRETAGEVITYEDELIDAVFHSTCGGHTENSEDVWATAVPYLRGVACPFCAGSRWSETVHEFSGTQFAHAIVPYVSAQPVSSTGQPLLGTAMRSSTGRIKSLSVAGETVTGRDFRTALGLPSTNFVWTISNDKVIFTTFGYGHGVGLCQYGANGMAEQNKTYREILAYYYQGTKVTIISVP